jgi:hypothetical protein
MPRFVMSRAGRGSAWARCTDISRPEKHCLTLMAGQLQTSLSCDDALLSWLREAVAVATNYRGVTTAMMAAIEDPDSALHMSCVTMRAAGTRLLERAQAAGQARKEIDGVDLFALVGALAWLGDQPALAQRADHLFEVIAGAILTVNTDGRRPNSANPLLEPDDG